VVKESVLPYSAVLVPQIKQVDCSWVHILIILPLQRCQPYGANAMLHACRMFSVDLTQVFSFDAMDMVDRAQRRKKVAEGDLHLCFINTNLCSTTVTSPWYIQGECLLS
jgi:hypothetical protein